MAEPTWASSSATQQDLSLAADPLHPDLPLRTAEARALLAWASEPDAHLLLTGGHEDKVLTAEQRTTIASARSSLRARPGGIDQSDLTQPLPGSMRDYIARLEEHPEAHAYLADGNIPSLVDLARVCAFQSKIYADYAVQRIADVEVNDVQSIAEVTLPLAPPAVITPQFDQQRQTFVTNMANQNLRIVGAFGGPADDAPPGTINLGFQIRVIASFVQVVRIQGRYFLRDGYHRCLGLLRQGVRYAPAFVRDNISLSELAAPGMLAFEVFMGDKPPVLPDYWDNAVSCSVQLPVARRVVVVQGAEISVVG